MIKFEEYKGKPVVKLKHSEDQKFPPPWIFGVAKAKLFIQHLKEIEEWIKENDRSN